MRILYYTFPAPRFQPNPLVEKKRQRIHYDKASGVYQPEDNPLLREIKPGHFVLMSDNEWAAYQKANA